MDNDLDNKEGAQPQPDITEEQATAQASEQESTDASGVAAAANDGAEQKVEAPAEIDWKDQCARLLADFDNFKKRTARDREDTFHYAEAQILKDFLPVVDNLQLALTNAANKDDPFVKGVQLVYDTFLNALKDHGAEPFDSIGLDLDTEKMDAIAQLPSDTIEEGKVSNEAKRGWMLKGKVLRAAQVVVSSGKGA